VPRTSGRDDRKSSGTRNTEQVVANQNYARSITMDMMCQEFKRPKAENNSGETHDDR
jgi:hypothetical protein